MVAETMTMAVTAMLPHRSYGRDVKAAAQQQRGVFAEVSLDRGDAGLMRPDMHKQGFHNCFTTNIRFVSLRSAQEHRYFKRTFSSKGTVLLGS